MREIQTIQISQIDYDKLPMNKKVLIFALEMKVGKSIFPPIRVSIQSNGRFKLTGGRHRIAAHKLLERSTIRAFVGVRSGSA